MTSDFYIENKVKLGYNVVRAIRNELSLEKETSLKLDDLLKITSLHVVDITNDEFEQIRLRSTHGSVEGRGCHS